MLVLRMHTPQRQFFANRLGSNGLSQKRLIHYLAVYVALGFVATELTLFLICRPLSNYWAVPTPNCELSLQRCSCIANLSDQCSSYQYYEIIQGCVAITADVLMLLVAIPLLAQVRVPLKQKLVLMLVFGMGIFVIIAAILTKVYCLVPSLISYVYMNWYFREATVAMLVTNLPLVWSLLREVFPAIRSWSGGSKKTSDRYRSRRWTLSKGSGLRPFGRSTDVQSRDFHMQNYDNTAMVTPKQALSDVSYQASEERDTISDDASVRALRIRQDITVSVDSEPQGHSSRYWEPGKL